MAEICNPSCNEAQIQTYAIPCNQLSATRKGGFERFILLDCESVFTDITSVAEWTVLQANQHYIFSPPGNGTLVQPESKKEKIRACAPEQVVDEISGFEWWTKLFDNDTYCDFEFENNVKEMYASKTVLWYGCDGLLYYNRNWTTGTNPGFGDLTAEVFRKSEVDTLQMLNINIKFNTYQTGLTAFSPTQALLDVIFSDAYLTSGGCGI